MTSLPSDTDKAAVLAEFEDDSEAVRTLLDTPPHDFLHAAHRLRDARAFDQEYAKAAAPYIEKGFTVLRPKGFPDQGRESEYPHFVESWHLQKAGGGLVTTDLIESAPQFWVVALSEYDDYYDKATGDRIEYDDVDWGTEDQIGATAAKGYRHTDEVEVRVEFSPQYLCIDYGEAGLRLTERAKASRSVALADRVQQRTRPR